MDNDKIEHNEPMNEDEPTQSKKSDEDNIADDVELIDLSNEDDDKKFLDFENFDQFFDNFSTLIKESVGCVNKMPIKQNDMDFFMTNPSFKSFMQMQNDRILKLIGRILKTQNIKKNLHSSKLDDDERMDMLIDVNDQIIERLGIQLDEIEGLRKKTETEIKLGDKPLNVTSRNINTSWNKDIGMVVNKSLLQTLQTTTNNKQSIPGTSSQFDAKKLVIEKPQKYFNDKIDNSNLPFLPKIRQKPNALVPLPEIFSKLDKMSEKELIPELFENNLELLENPYTKEIDQFFPNESDFKTESISEPLKPSTLDETPYKFIDNLDDLLWLCNHLGKDNRSKIKEISVDLEHHSYRSFLGFTCLMQISTRFDDFIIDTLKLRSEMYRLNEIFSDWTLLKIFHGADFDIEWLQKDFGIYVVNMFDTGQASRILQYPHFSLSYLLQRFCNVNAQKQYQLADWRQRPLSDPLIKYAREDTHYLLFIYDSLKYELIRKKKPEDKFEESPLFLVFDKSKLICKKTYRKPIFYSKGFLNICQNNTHMNAKQMKALHDLYTWRDRIARESDESCEYVLKSHQLLKIAELLPREIYGILALCNPLSHLVEVNVHEMHEIVKEAREYKGTTNLIEISLTLSKSEKNLNNLLNKVPPFGLNKIDASSLSLFDQKLADGSKNNAMESIVHLAKYDPDNILNCPHDFPHKVSQNELMEAQISETNAFEEVSKLELKDLLIKPNNQSLTKPLLPSDLTSEKKSSLSDSFVKDYSQVVQVQVKNMKKLQEKVKKIKDSVKNPLEYFLPIEFRSLDNRGVDSEHEKWNLIKAEDETKKQHSNEGTSISKTVNENENQTNTDFNMIPLKQQYKMERSLTHKFKKKVKKNVDFSDAIIEYNKSKVEKVMALGSEDVHDLVNDKTQQLNELINKKVNENLRSLSEQVKQGDFNFDEDETQTVNMEKNDINTAPFVYDPTNMNKLFAKPAGNEHASNRYDPSSKLKRTKFDKDKVNKRRATNAVTRSTHNQTLTYKEPKK